MTNISLEVTGLGDDLMMAILKSGIKITSTTISCNGHYEIDLTGKEEDLLHIVREYMDDDSLDLFRTNKILPIDQLNYAAEDIYGEFGFSSCDEDQQAYLVNTLFS